MGVICEPPNVRVTAINVSLTEDEKALLAFGPKFAVTNMFDEKLIDKVRKEAAACAYRLRCRECLSNINSCITQVQHFRLQGAPIDMDRPFAKPPPIPTSPQRTS